MSDPFIKEEGRVHVFCEKSGIGNWFVRHVVVFAASAWLFFLLITVPAGSLITWRAFIVGPFFVIPAILFRTLFRDLCSRVEIDTAVEKIRFFKFYNKKIVEAPARSVEFRFTWMLMCRYAGGRFTIPGEYMDSIAGLLPEGVEIKFPEGLWGRFVKRQFEKRKRAKSSGEIKK